MPPAPLVKKPRPRGAKPTPRYKLAAAHPHRIRGVTPPQFAIVPKQLSYWLNDQYGDCVTAEEAYAKACFQPEIFIHDSTVRDWASSNGVLNGADLLEVLQMMQKDGFHQDGHVYYDGPAQSVDYSNPDVLKNAISLGPVKLGVAAGQLENAVGNTNGWFGTGFRNDQNEDHSVSLSGYGTFAWLASQLGVSVPGGVDPNTQGYLLFTWDTVGIIDHASMVAITGEAWLRSPTTTIDGPAPPPPPLPPPGPAPTPIPVPTTGDVLVLSADLPAGTYSISALVALETFRAKFYPQLTPAQWLQIIMQLLAVILPLINPPPPAQMQQT